MVQSVSDTLIPGDEIGCCYATTACLVPNVLQAQECYPVTTVTQYQDLYVLC